MPTGRRFTIPLAALVLAACSDASSPRADASSAHPFCTSAMAAVDSFMAAQGAGVGRGGQTVVLGNDSEIVNGMNAFATVDVTANQFHQFVNLMTLVQVDASLEPVPYLAESWSWNDDQTAVTFALRQDVFWHDGQQTDAHDVAFTYLRATDPETAFPNSAFWDQYVTGAEGVEVVDDFTIRFRMQPHAFPLDPWRALGIMPEHLLADVPPAELAQHPFGSLCPVGNGPYVFQAHRAQESWSFEANPAFPSDLGGRPESDRLVYRVIPDPSVLLAELLSGGVDASLTTTPDQAELIVSDEDTELEVAEGRAFSFIGWNTRRPQLADARVRQAITRAIDREALMGALLGSPYGVVAESGVPPYHAAYDPTLEGPRYDPDAAAAALSAAGWVDRDGDGVRENAAGTPLSIEIVFSAGNAQRQTVAEFVESQLESVGIGVEVAAREPAELARRVLTPDVRDFDGLILEWQPEFRVDEKDLFHSDRIDGAYAFSGLRDARLDRLMDTLQTFTDLGEAKPFWSDYQSRIVELQPFTYLFYARKLVGRSAGLQGAEIDFRGELQNVARWRKAGAAGQ